MKKTIALVSLIAGTIGGCASPPVNNAEPISLAYYMPPCISNPARRFLCQKVEDKGTCSYYRLFGKESKTFRWSEEGKISIFREVNNKEVRRVMLKIVSEDGFATVISKNIDLTSKINSYEEAEDFRLTFYNVKDVNGQKIEYLNRYYSNGEYVYDYPESYTLEDAKTLFFEAEEILNYSAGFAHSTCDDFWDYAKKLFDRKDLLK